MTVVNQPLTLTSSDLLRQKFASDAQPSQSSGTAWAAITAPGLGSIWDKTAIKARLDPSQEQSEQEPYRGIQAQLLAADATSECG